MLPIVIFSGVVAVVAVLMIFARNYIKAEPNEALIITGRKYKAKYTDEDGRERIVVKGWRAVVGGATLRIPVIEKINRISLQLVNLPNVRVEKAYSMEGVPVTIDAVANVKISSEEQMLSRAVERFLGSTHTELEQIIKETLEGQLRDIIGVLTVEQLYQQRDMFVTKVLEQSGFELAKIGVIIDIINIQDIRDERGYLEALGVKRVAEVKRDAAIGRAEAERDAMQKSETARREGEVVKAEQERQIYEAQKNRDVASEHYRGETFGETNRANQQGPLAEAQARQEVVQEEQRVMEVEQKAREKVQQARAAAETQRYSAEVVVPAEADKQAVMRRAEGEAAKILRVKEAEAKGIRLVMQAEADGLTQKALAWEKFGNAAKLNLALEAMKIVAEKGADALGQIKFDNVVAIDSGAGGDGKSAIPRLMTAAPGALLNFSEQMKALFGIDLATVVDRYLNDHAEKAPATADTAGESTAEEKDEDEA